MATENDRIGTLDRWRHHIGATAELRASLVYCLMHRATLKEVVRLVGATTCVEEREDARNEQR